MPSKRQRLKNVIVNVNVPQSSVLAAKGGQYRAAAAGFLLANPILAIIIAVVGIAAFILIGGITLPIFLSMMFSPWMWIATIVVAAVMTPRSNTIIIFAILIGLAFWGYDVYLEYQALQQICNIPIIGWIACGAWNVITFIPKLFMLGLNVMVAFVQIWIVSFIKYQLIK